jgi:phosphatidylglycerol:prolipoprotein diacylglycerol transferase
VPPLSPVLAVIELTFSPIVSIGAIDVRLETVALAAVILAALVIAALIGGRTPVDLTRGTDALDEDGEPNHLRADDLLYLAVGALPGAVVGARIGYVLLHLDYYTANPDAILDISSGGMELALAVVGGTLTAAIVATMLGGTLGRWMHALILPVLLAIGAGKLAMALGGSGQGVPWDGAYATAYLGPGPWGSLAPEIPSHAAQVYEGVATFIVVFVLVLLLTAGRFSRRSGGLFLLGIALWALVRAGIATVWRDPSVVGPLNMEQVISLAIAAGAILLLVTTTIAARRARAPADGPAAGDAPAAADAAATTPAGGGTGPDWPDPTSRPRI